MRKPLIVGNWKMNTSATEAEQLARSVAETAATMAGRVELGIAPPFVWLERAASAAPGLLLYGQNVNAAPSGAHTGEIAGQLLLGAGARGVLIGHSERRHVYGEDDITIGRKVVGALDVGLTVILCVGETLAERDADRTWPSVNKQLHGALAAVPSIEAITIAYEPVWAIGTGRTATPEQAQEVHARIRAWATERYGEQSENLRIQYGGSVKPANAADLLRMPDIDGALVGGASLSAGDFSEIAAAANP